MEFPSSGDNSMQCHSAEDICSIEGSHPTNQDIDNTDVRFSNSSDTPHAIQGTRALPETDEKKTTREEGGENGNKNILSEMEMKISKILETNREISVKSVNNAELPALHTISKGGSHSSNNSCRTALHTISMRENHSSKNFALNSHDQHERYSSDNPDLKIPSDNKSLSRQRFCRECHTNLVKKQTYLGTEQDDLADHTTSLDAAQDKLSKYNIQLVENSKAIESLDARNKLLKYKSTEILNYIQGLQAAVKATEANLTSATVTAAKPVSTIFLQIASENQKVSEAVQTTFSNKKLLETPRVSKINQEINAHLLLKYSKDDIITKHGLNKDFVLMVTDQFDQLIINVKKDAIKTFNGSAPDMSVTDFLRECIMVATIYGWKDCWVLHGKPQAQSQQ